MQFGTELDYTHTYVRIHYKYGDDAKLGNYTRKNK
jgi:hypothetical protein